jgi:hypothetical protein
VSSFPCPGLCNRQEEGTSVAELWPTNAAASKTFEDAGWKWAGVEFYGMWLDGIVPDAQKPEAIADKEVFANLRLWCRLKSTASTPPAPRLVTLLSGRDGAKEC